MLANLIRSGIKTWRRRALLCQPNNNNKNEEKKNPLRFHIERILYWPRSRSSFTTTKNRIYYIKIQMASICMVPDVYMQSNILLSSKKRRESRLTANGSPQQQQKQTSRWNGWDRRRRRDVVGAPQHLSINNDIIFQLLYETFKCLLNRLRPSLQRKGRNKISNPFLFRIRWPMRGSYHWRGKKLHHSSTLKEAEVYFYEIELRCAHQCNRPYMSSGNFNSLESNAVRVEHMGFFKSGLLSVVVIKASKRVIQLMRLTVLQADPIQW